MIRFTFATLLSGLLLASPILAGKYNKKLSIGDAAPTYQNLMGVDGKKHSLTDLKDKDVVVLAITCNHCPVAVAYEDRMIEFAKKNAGAKGRIAFVAINVNNLEQDKLPQMKERAKNKDFPYLYIYDPSQEIARALGATVTPEFFVLNKERKIVYMGAMDNNMIMDKVKDHYLQDAVEALLKGKVPALAETRGFGCGVKYDKK